MAFIDEEDIHSLYTESKDEARIWRENYHEYERLADNDLIEGLDENLPEVNDGSLAAALFKLPKRIVSSKLTGRAKALDAEDAWITELANLQWENNIIPNANSQAPYHRKWKDVVRKAAIYGGQPVITLFVENGDYIGSDFIGPYCQDVTLEAGKVSDYDSDIIFWDIYLSKKQLDDMIEQAEQENADHASQVKEWKSRKAEHEMQRSEFPEMPEFDEEEPETYNHWDTALLKEIRKAKLETTKDSDVDSNQKQDKAVKKGGYKFYIAFQRGVDAPFYMYSCDKKKAVRRWTNPDPSGDVPVHYLYCYQDMINPYGVGIVKLAGGTQNVLDHMRQADVLATDLGIMPPIKIKGNEDQVDEESLVYSKNALWFVGEADVERQEMSNQVYQQLPERIAMYKTSLNQLIPVGDTSISSSAGDPNYSKTPAGVKFQANNLSIDDEDFKDNLNMTYAAVAKSMINIHFANMQGSDLMRLSDDERDLLEKAGLEFPLDESGNPTNELEILWDEARATFDFEVDADQDKAKEDAERLEGLRVAVDFLKDPNTQNLIATGQPIMLGTKKIDPGELIAEVIHIATDNDKIVQEVTPEDMEAQQEAELMAMEQEQMQQPQDEEAVFIQSLMEQFGVDEQTARAMDAAEQAGFSSDEIIEALARNQPVEEAQYV